MTSSPSYKHHNNDFCTLTVCRVRGPWRSGAGSPAETTRCIRPSPQTCAWCHHTAANISKSTIISPYILTYYIMYLIEMYIYRIPTVWSTASLTLPHLSSRVRGSFTIIAPRSLAFCEQEYLVSENMTLIESLRAIYCNLKSKTSFRK